MRHGRSTIERLWQEYGLPAADGLYFPDGRAFEVLVAPEEPTGLRVGGAFDVDRLLSEEPDLISHVDGLTALELPGGDILWAGEGSHGSDGFFGRVTPGRGLVWAVFLEEANPFGTIELSARAGTFTSTLGVSITIDIDDPVRGEGRP
ncbi:MULTISPECIES: hypothetical protein [unclassified Streptomyces]|uniref:hypothetical protein n=1 Tax=unclassified Streptomyces TaxID=2593676 RepID=UPI00093C084F|nr:hypothetical protein [Streptomyces sp. TSRI0107]OKJ84177.1 hypothetical protein AMK31_18900 [Streptomyces sp. TSRI0107]